MYSKVTSSASPELEPHAASPKTDKAPTVKTAAVRALRECGIFSLFREIAFYALHDRFVPACNSHINRKMFALTNESGPENYYN